MLPNSDVLEKVNIMVEFITTISGFTLVDERVRVIRSVVSINVKLQVKKLSVVLQVTSTSLPTMHTAALGNGIMVTAPVPINAVNLLP